MATSKTLAELQRVDENFYNWIDYTQDAKTVLFESLNRGFEQGYENILTDEAKNVADDLGNYDPAFEGVLYDEIVPWIEEWQASKNGL